MEQSLLVLVSLCMGIGIGISLYHYHLFKLKKEEAKGVPRNLLIHARQKDQNHIDKLYLNLVERLKDYILEGEPVCLNTEVLVKRFLMESICQNYPEKTLSFTSLQGEFGEFSDREYNTLYYKKAGALIAKKLKCSFVCKGYVETTLYTEEIEGDGGDPYTTFICPFKFIGISYDFEGTFVDEIYEINFCIEQYLKNYS